MESIFSGKLIKKAYQWACERRKKYHHNSDIWHLRFHWQREKEKLIKELHSQTLRFGGVCSGYCIKHTGMGNLTKLSKSIRFPGKFLLRDLPRFFKQVRNDRENSDFFAGRIIS